MGGIMRFKMMKHVLAASAALALTAGLASAESLKAEDLRKLAPGNYRISAGFGLVKLDIAMQPGGVLTGYNVKKGTRDKGVWTVQGDQLCIKWNRWLKKKNRCSTLSGSDGKYSGNGVTITKR
jgi:hypothetical protein